MNAPTPQTGRAAPARPVPRKTLAAVVGTPIAAAMLYMIVPAEESGREVEASVQADGSVRVRHVSGNQHLAAYRDIVGVATICDGDTKNVRMGQRETPEGCRRRLEQQLIAHAEPIIRCVPSLRGRTNQVVASVSLAYNIGTGGFCRSTAARHFNAGRWRQGCDAFLAWNKAGGRVVRGLALRRQRERALCLRGLR